MQTGTSRVTTDSNQRPAQATECLELRFKDLDFNTNQILVRDGKGQKDRITTLRASVKEPLLAHLRDVWRLHQKDLREGAGRVSLPYAYGG